MEICGVVAKLLVDTGATLSLISTTLMERIPEKVRPVLDRASRNVLNAGGYCLQLSGKVTFPAEKMHFLSSGKRSGRTKYRWYYWSSFS